MLALVQESLHLVVILTSLGLSLWASAHALLNKRDPRSAAAWATIAVLFPILGALLYALIGVNRIRTRARRLHDLPRDFQMSQPLDDGPDPHEKAVEPGFLNLAILGRAVSANALVQGNRVRLLQNGDEAYPLMIEAIEQASVQVWLASYIFEAHGAGTALVDALVAARARGVDVRVLIDGVGDLYAWPRASVVLRARGLRVERFLPPGFKLPAFAINLRNHRKLLLVDNRIGFTGGMNIRSRHTRSTQGRRGIEDVHFALEGAVVTQLGEVFTGDWEFATGEPLQPRPQHSENLLPGEAACRVIIDGPNEDMDKLTWMLVSAIGLARHSIRIVTPYFAPPGELIMALQTAALRGVRVDILLPANNNFRFMTWAAVHAIGPLLRTGVRVAFVPGAFVHSKLFVVDSYYAQIGSANLDQRSLRLNFELAVEIYDATIAASLEDYVRALVERSHPMNYAEWRSRRLPRRLRDGLFWLLSPYI